MSEVARAFIEDWVSENVASVAPSGPANMTRVRDLAAQCQAEAVVEGISDAEQDAAAKDIAGGADNLVEALAQAMEAAVDEQVQRIAGSGV